MEDIPIKVFMDSGIADRGDLDPDVPVINATFLNTEGEPVNIGAGGQPGPAGAAAGFGTPTATVDQTTGTANVTVSASGPDTAKVFAFKFTGLKGEKGDKGDQGAAGTPGATYTLPAATTAALGGVKMANAVADPTATTQATLEAISGDSVAVTDVNNVITQLNTTINNLNDAIAKQKQLLANLRSAGIISPSA